MRHKSDSTSYLSQTEPLFTETYISGGVALRYVSIDQSGHGQMSFETSANAFSSGVGSRALALAGQVMADIAEREVTMGTSPATTCKRL